jgi:outer membrane beta-barrel protein
MRSKYVVFTLLFLAISSLAHARDEADVDREAKDDYDFSWLDPDKKINVVQNRKYSKAQRAELGVAGGIGIGEPYRRTREIIPRLTYYFNEHLGISALAGFVSNAENENIIDLKVASSTIPAVRDTKSFYGGSFVWLPFYGKVNLFNRIFYFDWQFEVGVAHVTSEIDLNNRATEAPILEESNHMGVFWGTGHKYFIDRNWAARIDFDALYYKAPVAFGGVYTGRDEIDVNYYLTLGVSYTF